MSVKGKRTLRTDLPDEVWDRLAAEAAARGVTLAAHTRNLIVKRDTRIYGASPSTPDNNTEVSRNTPSNRKK